MPPTPFTPRTVTALLVAACTAAPAALTGCAALGEERSGIVVTTNILGDVTRSIVGDEADISVLMKPNADPHSFGVSAQHAAELEEAELIVYNGLGLEEEVLRNVTAAEEAGTPALAVGEHVDPIDYADGDSEGEPDPHFWTDPLRMAEAADLIAETVVERVDGVDEERIRANAGEYRLRIEELHEEATERFADIPPERRKLVTNHHVFGYLAQRYDFDVVGAVVPSGTTLASPSSADLKSLADAVTEARVPAVFADSSQPDRLAEVMAKETGLDIDVITLISESLTEEGQGGATYLEMTRYNTESIAAGLANE